MPLKLLRPQDSSAYPAPEAVYNWRVYALAISAAMGSAMFGYDIGFIGGSMTLPSFRSKFGLDRLSGDNLASLNANIVSLFQAGAFFASILVSYFAERLGRKIPLMFCGALWDVGVILQVASNGKVGLLYGGRVLTGESFCSSVLGASFFCGIWDVFDTGPDGDTHFGLGTNLCKEREALTSRL